MVLLIHTTERTVKTVIHLSPLLILLGFFLPDITDSSSSIMIFCLYFSFLLHLLFIKILIQSRSH